MNYQEQYDYGQGGGNSSGLGNEFVELEEVDAVRMVWNVWPRSRLEAAKCVVPFGVIYTPVKETSNLQVCLEWLLGDV